MVSGTGRTPAARRGLPSARTNPARSAPASAAAATSSSRVSPHTFTNGRERSSASFAPGSGGTHERRADEDRVGAGQLGGSALRARLDPALGDDHAIARRACDEAKLLRAVDAERREIPRVDADHGRAERDRALELLRIVRFDERVEAELCGDSRGAARPPRRRDREAGGARHRRLLRAPCAGARRSRRSPSREAEAPRTRARRAGRPTCRRSARRRGSTPQPPQPVRTQRRALAGSASGRRSPADGERRFTSAIAVRPGRRRASSKRPITGILARTPRAAPAGPPRGRSSIASSAAASPSARSAACPAATIAPAAFNVTAARFAPVAPARTSRAVRAFSSGEPPASSAGSQGSIPSSTGSITRSRTGAVRDLEDEIRSGRRELVDAVRAVHDEGAS